MTLVFRGLTIMTLLAVGRPTALAQTPASAPATQPASQPATSSAPADEVAVVVDGRPILESELRERVRTRTPQAVFDDPKMAGMLVHYRGQMLDVMIDQRLFDDEVERQGIKLSDAEMAEAMEDEFKGYLSNNGLTRAEFETQIRVDRGQTIEEFLAARVADPARRQAMARNRLIERSFPDVLLTPEEELRQQYDDGLERRYTKPEQVRVSQILIGGEFKTAAEKAAARQRAEAVLAEARKPGADFAALARQLSACPSKVVGGDVGLLGRQGRFTTALVDAAFALKEGEISDLIESKAGFHIIKVTERVAPQVIPYEQAKEGARQVLVSRKTQSALKHYVTELRQKASIVYPPGKEPATLDPMKPSPLPVQSSSPTKP